MGIPLKPWVCSSRGGSVLCRVSSRIAWARFALQQKPAAPGARGLTQGSRRDRLGVSAGKEPGARLQGLGRFHPPASLCSTARTAKQSYTLLKVWRNRTQAISGFGLRL